MHRPNLSLLLICLFLLGSGGVLICQENGAEMNIEKVNVFGESPATHATNLPETSAVEAPASSPKEIPAAAPKKTTSESQRSWILKYNPCLIVHGEVPFYLERKLSRNFSIEGALGTTFEDYFRILFVEGGRIGQTETNTEKLSGVAAKLALRYYPKHTALSDVYISPEIDFTNYRKLVTGDYSIGSGGYTAGRLMDQQKYVDYLLILGTQSPREKDEEIFLDWFLGAGLRTGQEYNVVRYENNISMIAVQQKTIVAPMITLGMKLGLGF
jgi:hypothetical protein